jgi:cytochrome c peroxidase
VVAALAVWAAGIASAAPDPAALRAQAATLIKPLPDKMPGAEQDTPAMIKLGEKLFFDKRLSINESQSCNSCHMVDQAKGGVDNEPTSEGAFHQRGGRNSPTVLNAGLHLAQFWDGRAKDLVEQAKGPILNPIEMAMPREDVVIQRLGAVKEYQALFKDAFPGAAQSINYDHVAQAIAAFERTLITRDRFDDFLKGDDRALNDGELKGLELFLTTGCTTCHMGSTIGGTMFQKAGLVHPYPNTNDVGRIAITKDEDDLYKFKVPSLRNIALTAPYFHDGAWPTLEAAVRQMAYMQLDKQLTDEEVQSLASFLRTLTDKPREPKH